MNKTANLGIERPLVQSRQSLEFISFLTHELKTPLTSIIAAADLLSEEMAVPNDDSKAKLINNILASAHNLEVRTSELLELAKLEAEGFDLELELVDINTIARSAIDQVLPIIHSRGQSFTTNLASHLPTITADSLRIEQVILNLLSNAIKFTSPNGDICLTTDMQNNHIVIKVKDSGLGIPLKEQNNVFQSYYRLKSDKEQISGIGLGLALCKHLVELHGGKIWVRSEPDVGSIFAFSLPIRPAFAAFA